MSSQNARSGSDIGRKSAEAISKAALANAKFEGDYARIMTATAPAPATPAPGTDGGARRRHASARDRGRGDARRHAGDGRARRRNPKGPAEELIG